ncbi:hypothetical protein ACHAWT_009247, partial [Skeletonema menzelii]
MIPPHKSGATGNLQKLSNHYKHSGRLSSVNLQSIVDDPLVALLTTTTTIRCAQMGPGSAGTSTLSTSINNADCFITNLPDDILCSVFKFLDVKSLLCMRECNTKLCSAASSNNAGWSDHCSSLWSRKVNVCSRATSLLAQSVQPRSVISLTLTKNVAMEAFKTSVVDAATRNEVSLEELCYDESPLKGGPTWSFRFKKSAGSDWTSWDPWWNDKQARKLVFLRDGSIMQLQPEGKTAPCRIHNGVPLYDVFSERMVHRDGVDVIPPRIELKWRFVKRPVDLPARPEGAYVRITLGGRDVPSYVVRRSPNGNWGFILENCWGIYASFDLAPRGSATSYVSSRRLLRRTRNETRWANVDADDGDSEDPDQDSRYDARNVRQRTDFSVEEPAIVVTSRLQWREALLYNIGAVVLPEGNNANAEQEELAF